MNHIYKIIRNRTGKLVVVGETAKSHIGGQSTKVAKGLGGCLVMLLLGMGQSWAGSVCDGSNNAGEQTLGSTAVGNDAFACGHLNTVSGSGSIAVGIWNEAPGNTSSALGSNNTASGQTSSALGYWNKASGAYSSAVGSINTASGEDSSALGYRNTASGQDSSALGYQNTASDVYSSAVGYRNTASGENSSAVGSNNTASGKTSSALGYGNSAIAQSAAAMGNGIDLNDNTRFRTSSEQVESQKLISVNGIAVTATGTTINTITHIQGKAVNADERDSFLSSLILGNVAAGEYSSAVGVRNLTIGQESSAFGYANDATADGSSVFGVRSQATAKNASAIGYDSLADEENTISIGRAGAEKRLTNLANATKDTDAVNLRQMREADIATLNSAKTYADAGDIATLNSAKTYADAGDTATLNSAKTYADAGDTATLNSAKTYTDAGDTATLNSAKTYTDNRITALERSFSDMDKSANAGIASALAVGNLPQPTLAGRSMFSMGAANHNSQQAIAIGLSTVTHDNKYVLKGGFSTNTNRDLSTAVAVGWQW